MAAIYMIQLSPSGVNWLELTLVTSCVVFCYKMLVFKMAAIYMIQLSPSGVNWLELTLVTSCVVFCSKCMFSKFEGSDFNVYYGN